MKTKFQPIAQVDCETGCWRVVFQFCAGGMIAAKLFDGTESGYAAAMAFARSITDRPDCYAALPEHYPITAHNPRVRTVRATPALACPSTPDKVAPDKGAL